MMYDVWGSSLLIIKKLSFFLFVLGDVQIFELFEISVLERIQLLNKSADSLYWNLQIYNLRESSIEEV